MLQHFCEMALNFFVSVFNVDTKKYPQLFLYKIFYEIVNEKRDGTFYKYFVEKN
jgi:hypothetical protein